MSPPAQQKVLSLESKCGQFIVKTIDVPKPGAGEVLVRVEATALNPLDWKVQALGMMVEKYPAVLGFDAAGTIVEIGQDVSSFAVGDRVMVQGRYDPATLSVHGTFLQFLVSPAKFTAKIPASISFDAAATIPSGLAAAALPLYNQNESAASARLLPFWAKGGRGKYAGRPFLVLGGASSLGQFAIQVANLSGFSPIVATASLHNAEFLKSLGATHVLDRKLPAEALKAEATKIAGGLFGNVYDAVSNTDTLAIGYALTAPQGDFIFVLPVPEYMNAKSDSGKKAHFVHGLFMSPVNHAVSESLLAAVPQLIESGDIKPNREENLPGGLHAIVNGLERLRKDQVSGTKLVVRPQDTL